MGKLYQRYKRNGRQVGEFTEAKYKEVEEINSEDSISIKATDNQLQLESVARRNEPLTHLHKSNEHEVKQSVNGDLDNPTFDIPQEFKQHLSEYISSQNRDSGFEAKQPQPVSPNPPTNEPPQPTKEQYEMEAAELGFTDLPKNLAHSLISWKKSGRPVVESHQWNHRISICRSCSFWTENKQTNYAKCTKCGCGSGKLLLASSKCPLNPPKW
tara:strand:+ start:711 stop:1349 length:639 start_codon:yes stop_codon:yes gene_type:complete